MTQVPLSRRLEWLLIALVLINTLVWFYARNIQAVWTNVPPVPTVFSATASAIGDQQLAYRMIGLMLQNMGDHGGRTTSLKDYDFDRLGEWFFLADQLDPKSDFAPFLAAFYFSAVQDSHTHELPPLIDYLEHAGNRPDGEKWRWLAHAIYLARFKIEDFDRAFALSRKLAAIDKPDMPGWTKQMPAFVQAQRGDKEAALDIMIEILKSSAEDLHPNEVNFTIDYICTRLLDESEATGHPLCQDLPQ